MTRCPTGRDRRWAAVAAVLLWMPAACSPLAAGEPGETSLAVEQDETTLSILDGGRPLLEYRYSGAPFKPYATRFFSPRGVNVLRDAPHDHLHHHALMYAVAVDGVDFWSEYPNANSGTQAHRSLEVLPPSERDGLQTAGFMQRIDWLSADRQHLLSERRTIEAGRAPGPGPSLVTWRAQFEPAPGRDSVTLTGSHYFGLGIRFIESMDKTGRFFNADGREGVLVRGEERLVQSKWCAYTAPAGDTPVTVALFGHPQNVRHPVRVFTMSTPFAYLSATLNLWKEPLDIRAGEPLRLVYGVALWDGEVGAEQIDRLWDRWAEKLSADEASPGR